MTTCTRWQQVMSVSAKGRRMTRVFAAVVALVVASLIALNLTGCGSRGGTTGKKLTTGALVVTTLAGKAGARGSSDGTGAGARFSWPAGIACDAAGNLYVADYYNCTIRKITPAGVVTTVAGKAGVVGSADGSGAAARFSGPAGIACDAAGDLYVCDNDTIRKITPARVVTTLAGKAGVKGSTDGTGATARFDDPGGIACDRSGNLYVCDFESDTIRKITPARVVTTLAGKAGVKGSTDGTGATARFDDPGGVACDAAGDLYVCDNNTIRRITPAGVVTTLAGKASVKGSSDGTGVAARFNRPVGVASDAAGNLYVADAWSDTIRKITAAGVVTTLAGKAGARGSSDGTGATARFNSPVSIACDAAGDLYVGDAWNATIRKITWKQ